METTESQGLALESRQDRRLLRQIKAAVGDDDPVVGEALAAMKAPPPAQKNTLPKRDIVDLAYMLAEEYGKDELNKLFRLVKAMVGIEQGVSANA